MAIIHRRTKPEHQPPVRLSLRQTEITCPKCKKSYSANEAYTHQYICPACGKYIPVGPKERICMVLDDALFEPWFESLTTGNPLQLAGYEEKLTAAAQKSGNTEAVTIGCGRIGGIRTVIGVCDPYFMIGSMGQVMGERITRAFERATAQKLPVVLFCCSGGARMQEGMVSLMQMEKTAAAVKRHSDAGLFYCAVLTDPTMGGVTASFATLADVIIAERQARIGFAGPRVIQQTIGQLLPKGFQTAEFLLEHGMVDTVSDRTALRSKLQFLLETHCRVPAEPARSARPGRTLNAETAELLRHREKTPWEKVKMCRSSTRAGAMDYISRIFSDFRELHGDRCFGDDHALVGGIAVLDGQPVTILANVRGKTVEERLRRNFGMPKPEGYRKAVRLMKQAEKFRRPVISFINTPGAFCGVDAEERGQGEAIARSIMEMSALKTPTLAILIGEGGSGGALATAVGNQVWMLEHATYSILSPEGYSSILWKTEQRAEEAAGIMRITAQDLAEMGIVDRIIPEFGGATEKTAGRIAAALRSAIAEFLEQYRSVSGADAAEDRYARFRRF